MAADSRSHQASGKLTVPVASICTRICCPKPEGSELVENMGLRLRQPSLSSTSRCEVVGIYHHEMCGMEGTLVTGDILKCEAKKRESLVFLGNSEPQSLFKAAFPEMGTHRGFALVLTKP